MYIAPFQVEGPIGQSAWIAVTDGKSWEFNPVWSPDGKLIYFFSDRDGFRCIWARRFDPFMKRPVSAPFPILHSHGSRRSLMRLDVGQQTASLAHDKMVFSMGERTGNIWMAEWKEQ